MRGIIRILALMLVVVAYAAAQIPFLQTESATPLGRGVMDAGIGFEYLQKNHSPAPDNPRSLFRVFSASLRHGVAENVDYDLTWRGGLVANLANGRSMFDWGDLSVWTTIGVVREGISVPGFALQSGVKLPNTRHSPAGLGSNQMDFHSRLLVSKTWSEVELRGNAGFAILGDPTNAGSQDDVYSISLAGLYAFSEGRTAFGEILAQTGYQDHDEKIVTRAGITVESELLTWTVYGTARVAGNNRDFATPFEHSQNWSVGVYFQRSFHAPLWSRMEEPLE